MNDAEADAIQLAKQLVYLTALLPYVRHKPGCNSFRRYNNLFSARDRQHLPCTCGLDARRPPPGG
jgi:hypothetical protein